MNVSELTGYCIRKREGLIKPVEVVEFEVAVICKGSCIDIYTMENYNLERSKY